MWGTTPMHSMLKAKPWTLLMYFCFKCVMGTILFRHLKWQYPLTTNHLPWFLEPGNDGFSPSPGFPILIQTVWFFPRCSMYGKFTYMNGQFLMVNVGEYTIHGECLVGRKILSQNASSAFHFRLMSSSVSSQSPEKHVGWSRVSLYCIDVYVYYFFRYTCLSADRRERNWRNDPKQAGFPNMPAVDGPIKHIRSECWPYMNHCAQTRCSWLSAGSINQKWESIFTLKWHTVGRNPAANRQEDLWRFAGFYTSQVPNIFL